MRCLRLISVVVAISLSFLSAAIAESEMLAPPLPPALPISKDTGALPVVPNLAQTKNTNSTLSDKKDSSKLTSTEASASSGVKQSAQRNESVDKERNAASQEGGKVNKVSKKAEALADKPTNEETGSKDFLKEEIAVMMNEGADEAWNIDPVPSNDSRLSPKDRLILKRKFIEMEELYHKEKRIKAFLKHNYKIQTVPEEFYRQVNGINKHLPRPIFQEDYNKAAFLTVANGDINALRALLNGKVPVEVVNQYGQTLLIYAVMTKQIDAVRLLLARGVPINAVDREGSTALHIANIKGYDDIANLLLIMGASPSIVDKQGIAPFGYQPRRSQAIKSLNILQDAPFRYQSMQ
jgi:hypothetical protein